MWPAIAAGLLFTVSLVGKGETVSPFSILQDIKDKIPFLSDQEATTSDPENAPQNKSSVGMYLNDTEFVNNSQTTQENSNDYQNQELIDLTYNSTLVNISTKYTDQQNFLDETNQTNITDNKQSDINYEKSFIQNVTNNVNQLESSTYEKQNITVTINKSLLVEKDQRNNLTHIQSNPLEAENMWNKTIKNDTLTVLNNTKEHTCRLCMTSDVPDSLTKGNSISNLTIPLSEQITLQNTSIEFENINNNTSEKNNNLEFPEDNVLNCSNEYKNVSNELNPEEILPSNDSKINITNLPILEKFLTNSTQFVEKYIENITESLATLNPGIEPLLNTVNTDGITKAIVENTNITTPK